MNNTTEILNINNVKLINGDSLVAMESIEDKSVELILTDPPYNLGKFMDGRATNMGQLRNNHFSATDWDHISYEEWVVNMDSFLRQSSRVIKVGGSMIIFMSLIKVETIIKLAEKHKFYYKTTGIWHKKNPMPRNMNLHFVNSTEAWLYFTHGKKTGTFNNNGKVIHDFLETGLTPKGEKKFGGHPTQKPETLMDTLITLLTNENETVIDPFMGSGTTGVSAMKLKRKFVGIEISKKYFEAATMRMTASLPTLLS